MRILPFYILFLLFGAGLYGQQEPLYTQFMYNKQLLNPAYAGTESSTCLSLFYRDQWNGFIGAPQTQGLSLSMPLQQDKVGVGINITNQSIGITEKLTLEGIYAYKFKVSDGILSMGGMISNRRYTVDFTDDRLMAAQGLDLDPSIPREKRSRNLLNFGFGAYFTNRIFFIGVSIPRLSPADLDFDQNNVISEEKRHLNFMTGGAFAVRDNLTLTPQLLVRLTENAPLDFDLNLSATIKDKLTLGLNYRGGGNTGSIGESLDFICGIQFNPQIMMGFSYDLVLSDIRSYQNGSIEAVFHYCFKKIVVQEEIINPRYF